MAGQLTFQVTRPRTSASGAQVHGGEQRGEHEEHRDAEDQLGDDVGQDHQEVGRRRDRAAPAVDAERERDAERDRDQRGEHRQPHGLDHRGVQLRVVQHRVDRVGEVPAPGEALPGGLRAAVVEREQHGDRDRHQRPDQVQPGETLEEPRVAPRVAPGQPAAAGGLRAGAGGGRGGGRRAAGGASGASGTGAFVAVIWPPPGSSRSRSRSSAPAARAAGSSRAPRPGPPGPACRAGPG